MEKPLDKAIHRFQEDFSGKVLTLGELVEIAEEENISLSSMVVAEAMVKEHKGYEEVLTCVTDSFKHNLKALELGITTGVSFLLGTVGSDLAGYGDNALIEDTLINRAMTYTLATEVGNHEIGLNPCAGTGDSCPYTGLIRALQQHPFSWERIAQLTALILKIGGIFRAGKTTTGCNMEGLGAGAAVTAALTREESRGTHYREDFPQKNPAWGKRIALSRSKYGSVRKTLLD